MLTEPPPELTALLAGRPATHVQWGLERTRSLLDAVGAPETRFRAFHLAGTNGKGSAAATAAAVLRAAGRKVGLYTSPHLRDVRERIRLDGAPLPDPVLESAARRLRPTAERVEATYFEALTAVAFLAFEEAGAEDAVIEVGMGGRLDATNVLRPSACAITTVALDHLESLGRTVAAIAAEKAGILKPGVPAALGRMGRAARGVCEARAGAVGAPLVRLGRDARVGGVRLGPEGTAFRYRGTGGAAWALRTPLLGRHQAENAGVALLMLEAAGALPEERTVREALAGLRWPGRFQRLDRADGTWILDVAHNPAGVRALAATLEAASPPEPIVLLLGVLADKPWGRMRRALPRGARGAVLTVPPSAPEGRRWDPAAAAAAMGAGAEAMPDFGRAMARARELAGSGTVVVAGSFAVVGDALARLFPPAGAKGR